MILRHPKNLNHLYIRIQYPIWKQSVSVVWNRDPFAKGLRKFNEDKNTLDFISCKDIIYEMEELLINYSGEYSGVEPLKQFPPFHFFIFYGFLEEQQPLLIEQSKL